ncbi:MAG: hypothetical protein R2734_15635 [Nocardioides sp.]
MQPTTHRLVLAVGNRLRRLTPTGALDGGFGVGGSAVLAMTQARQVTALADGRLLVPATSGGQLEVFRLTEAGRADTSWSDDGRVSYAPPVPADTTTYSVWPPRAVVRPGGQVLLVAGVNQTRPGAFDVPMVVVQLKADGSLDATFTPSYRIGFEAQQPDLALQVNGKLLISGRLAGSLDTGVQRLRANGRVDGSFADAGVLSDADDQTYFGDVAVQRGGRVLVSGVAGTWPSLAAFVRGYAGDAVAQCQGRWPTQMGSAGADRLVGTPGRDVMSGLGGADTLIGRGGGDVLCGGGGPDVLKGGGGADVLSGGQGDDKLVGGRGKDTLIGGPGADIERQ